MRREPPHGAVIIAGVAFLALLAVVMGWLARSAILTNEKTRADALADASAKSVATWYAQILNYDAYTNRAIAANEILIAQAATMTAWTQHVQTLSRNLGMVAQLIPPVQPVAVWIQEASVLSHEMAKTAAMIETPLRSGYTRALQSSQTIMHASATPFAAQAMVNEVIWTADSRFFGQIIPSSGLSDFYNATRNYQGADRRDFATLVQQTQDSFSRSRNENTRLLLMPTVSCIPTSTDRAFARLAKRGGTWISRDLSDWESADTLSIHTWRKRSGWNPTCGSLRESIALGWGASDASISRSDGIQDDPAGVGGNPGAFSRARSELVGTPGYLGLSDHRELSAPLAQARGDVSIRVPVLVRLSDSKIRASRFGQTIRGHAISDAKSGNLWSLSVAETHFLRPPDTLPNSATREFANLFAPFWGARLVPPTLSDRSVATALTQGKLLQ